MAGIDTNLFGLIGRQLFFPKVDGAQSAGPIRKSRYEELFALNPVPSKQLLADEASYFVANNAQSGLATAAAPTAFSPTNPFITIFNRDQVGGKRIILDYATLLATAAGTAGANLQMAVVIDQAQRYASGGTQLTPVSPNSDSGVQSLAQIFAGNITATAASPTARMVVGNRYLKGAIPVAGDQYFMQFGAGDLVPAIQASTITFSSQPLPPLVIGAQDTALIYLWLPSQSAASSYAPDLGWFER